MFDYLLQYSPVIVAWLLGAIAIVLVWKTPGIAIAVGTSTAFLLMGAEVMDETVSSFRVFNPGGAFLFMPALALVAVVAARDNDEEMAARLVRLTSLAMMFYVATKLQRVGYLFSDPDDPHSNKVLVDLPDARNAVLAIIAYYACGIFLLSARKNFQTVRTHLWVKLTLPVILSAFLFTPFNILAVYVSHPVFTPAQEAAVGYGAYVVRVVVEASYMTLLYFLIRTRKDQNEAHAVAASLSQNLKDSRWKA